MRRRSVSRRASCADFLGELRLVDLLEQLDRFLLARIGFAELRLDRAQLLAQIELALVLLDLDLGLLLHVLHHARARDFALEAREDEAQPLSDVEALQHLVLVGDAEVHVRRRQVGEPTRIGDVHLEDRRHFVRNAVDQFGERLRRRHDARDEIVESRSGRPAFLARRGSPRSDRARSARCLRSTMRRSPCSVICTVSPGRLMRSCTRAATPTRPRKRVCVDRLVVVAARDDQRDDQSGLFVRAEQRQVFRRAHLHRDRSERVDDRRAQRHQRQRWRQLRLEDFVLALGLGHVVRRDAGDSWEQERRTCSNP